MGKKKPMKKILFYLGEKENILLREGAKRLGLSISSYLRMLINQAEAKKTR